MERMPWKWVFPGLTGCCFFFSLRHRLITINLFFLSLHFRLFHLSVHWDDSKRVTGFATLSPSDLSINKERRCMEMESRKIGSTEVVVEGHSGGKISVSKENFSELLLRGKLQSRNSARFFRRLSVRSIHCWCMNNFRFRINVVFDADFADIQIRWISKTLSLTSIHSTFLATGFQNHSTFCTLTIAKMPLTAYL